jgi:hypothetical protein
MSHAHDHSPAAPHSHARTGEHAGEDYAARTHPEFVVLEIGDHVGALIVHTDADMHGLEIEISPEGDDDCRSHKQVLERSINGRSAFTAVFDALSAGTYSLWTHGHRRARGVTVEGGSIGTLDWRAHDKQATAPRQRDEGSSAPRSPALPDAA